MKFEEIARTFEGIIKGENRNGREASEQIISLLTPMLSDPTYSTEQRVFAYWNVSDNYAILREHEGTYRNHRQFEQFLSDQDERYKLMLVCDATQKLSLVCGGYEKYWNRLYYDTVNACRVGPKNYVIYFQALRCALYYRDNIAEYRSVGAHALDKMEEFLDLYRDDPQAPWFEMTYWDCRIKYEFHVFGGRREMAERSYPCFERLAACLRVDEQEKRLAVHSYENVLFGTYESWNSQRSPYVQARCVQNYIITLIDCGYRDLARKCLSRIPDGEFTTPYFKRKTAGV